VWSPQCWKIHAAYSDALIFVADTQPVRRGAVVAFAGELAAALPILRPEGHHPLVAFQLNKVDLSTPAEREALRAAINPGGWKEFPSNGRTGEGYREALRHCILSVLEQGACEVGALDAAAALALAAWDPFPTRG